MPTRTLAIGDQVGSYRIVGHLVDDTFRAVHITTAQRALIDVGSRDDWHNVSAYMVRAQRLGDLLQHPGVAKVVERGMLADHRPWTATEVPSGIALFDLIARRTMPATETTTLIRDVADVLAYAHARGIVHRGLTLRSIVLATGPRAWPIAVGDWGLPAPELGVFSAPELSTDAPHDGRADVFALGVIAFRAATCRFPGEGGVFDVPGAPTALATLIARMLAIDPAERPTSLEVHAASAELLGDLTAALVSDDVVRAAPRFKRPKWTPAPQPVITSERAPTASGEITKKPS
jgi:serine/threonine-protein kinase